MKLLYKDAILKIKESFGRFLSVLLIVALGVGFFAGLREATPDMFYTLDHYYDEHNLMDFKIVSTAGLTEDDVRSLKELEHVEKVVPSYSLDALEEGNAVRVHSLEDDINQVELINGRMPKEKNECLADNKHYKVGDTITLDSENVGNQLEEIEYRVVGTVDSVLYVGVEKGISTVGNGKLNSFLFVPKENFKTPYYTEVYLTAKNTKEKESDSKAYEEEREYLNQELLELKPIRETKRYEELKEQAASQILLLEQSIASQRQKITEMTQYGIRPSQAEREIWNQQIQLMEEQVTLAKQELETLPKPEWYLLDRTDQTGYTALRDDINKVDAIAQVFPVFFILVAALMCFNTMTRMIEEERTQIGILSSLGYSRLKIIHSYIFYVLIATILGVTIGLLVGYTTIPNIIYNIYHTNYILPDLIVQVKWGPFALIVGITILLMCVVTIFAVMKELSEKPAVLLRPKAPKMGKKVLLERVPILWKHFTFTWKVTSRNIFRYKKRVFMTIIGILGCTALLLTGFGLRDDINRLGDLQYGELIHYDAIVGLKTPATTIEPELHQVLETSKVEKTIPLYQETMKFYAGEENHDVYMMAMPSDRDISNFITLRSQDDQKKVKLKDDGVVITEKMAQLLGAEKDGFIKVRNSQNELFVLHVTDIVENYTMHYIYMNEVYYREIFGSDMEYNVIMIKGLDVKEDAFAQDLINSGTVTSVNFTSDNTALFDRMVDGLNQIIYLIIIAASMLAFVVLYNLTAINIMERMREIATLKVLGFYDKEVSSYVYRETFLLTVLGSFIGLIVGIALHRYVMLVAETDDIMFLKQIEPLSYLYAFVITILLSAVIQIFTYFKLKKIDMISSLKSVE